MSRASKKTYRKILRNRKRSYRMVMTALAWSLKAWFGLLMPDAQRGATVGTTPG